MIWLNAIKSTILYIFNRLRSKFKRYFNKNFQKKKFYTFVHYRLLIYKKKQSTPVYVYEEWGSFSLKKKWYYNLSVNYLRKILFLENTHKVYSSFLQNFRSANLDDLWIENYGQNVRFFFSVLYSDFSNGDFISKNF